MADKQYSYDTTKYYSPTINEFYVGFEYETWTDADGWNKKVYELEDFVNWSNCGNDIEEPPYGRVKILDKEDIESLGFTLTEEVSPFYGKNKFTSKTIPQPKEMMDGHDTTYFIEDEQHQTIRITKLCEGGFTGLQKTITQLYFGTIKNKSELKRLLNNFGYKNK